MQLIASGRIALLLGTLGLVGCAAVQTPPQYGAGTYATEDERYCQGVAQNEAEQVKRQNRIQGGIGAGAGAVAGGVVGHNLNTDRTIEGATLGALGGASIAYLANRDNMRSAYDTAYRRCMDAQRDRARSASAYQNRSR